jgi:uncharacterized lipoprotein NlpE involved in copper resistance
MRIQIAIAVTITVIISSIGFFPMAAVPDQHTSQNSLDWNGTYSGVTPCADCEGIETTLTLNKDLTYALHAKYRGKDNKVISKQGTFTWEKNGQVILLNELTESPSRYFVGENQLFQLNLRGEKITGKLADKYILRKKPGGSAN